MWYSKMEIKLIYDFKLALYYQFLYIIHRVYQCFKAGAKCSVKVQQPRQLVMSKITNYLPYS